MWLGPQQLNHMCNSCLRFPAPFGEGALPHWLSLQVLVSLSFLACEMGLTGMGSPGWWEAQQLMFEKQSHGTHQEVHLLLVPLTQNPRALGADAWPMGAEHLCRAGKTQSIWELLAGQSPRSDRVGCMRGRAQGQGQSCSWNSSGGHSGVLGICLI